MACGQVPWTTECGGLQNRDVTARRMAGRRRPGYAFVVEAYGEAPVTMGHGGERGAVAGRGHLRASHADREHVIEVLKAASMRESISLALHSIKIRWPFLAENL